MIAKEKRKKIISRIVIGLVVALIAYVVLKTAIGLIKHEPIVIFNHCMFIVRSDSMEPNINTGDMVLVSKINMNKIHEGDVASFVCIDPSQPIYGQNIVHRVVEIQNNGGVLEFITKGDNNPSEDIFHVTSSNYFGKVVLSSSFLGLIFDKVNATYLLVFVVVLLMIADFIVKNIKKIIKLIKQKKQEDEKERIRQEILNEIENKEGE